MNDDILDLQGNPDLFSMMIKHYTYEAEVYLSKFDNEATKEVIKNYIDSWNELSKNFQKKLDKV